MNAQAPTSYGIVVGYDGSVASQLAVGWAAETARQQGKHLTLVHSVNLAGTPGFPAMDFSELEPSLEHAAKALVDEGAERASTTLDASQVETQYWLGSAAAQLIDASRDAELLVVGSRGRGRLLAGLLGSTSYAVAAHAQCPVVVVRGPEGETPDDVPIPPRPGPDTTSSSASTTPMLRFGPSTPPSRSPSAKARCSTSSASRTRRRWRPGPSPRPPRVGHGGDPRRSGTTPSSR